MTTIPQIEMKIHETKDQLAIIEDKLNDIADKIDALIDQMEENEKEIQAIQEKWNDV